MGFFKTLRKFKNIIDLYKLKYRFFKKNNLIIFSYNLKAWNKSKLSKTYDIKLFKEGGVLTYKKNGNIRTELVSLFFSLKQNDSNIYSIFNSNHIDLNKVLNTINRNSKGFECGLGESGKGNNYRRTNKAG